jgi:multidrug resistance efflux pump
MTGGAKMQTTRTSPAEAIERPAAPATPPAPGRSGFRVLYFVLFGIILAFATILATGWMPGGSHASDPAGPAEDSSSKSPKYAIANGYVDVESRPINILSTQPGEVTEIPDKVRENARIDKGKLLIRLDDRQAKLSVQLAEEALNDSKIKLQQAEKVPEQHEALIRQQESVLEATKSEQARADALFKKADRLYNSKPNPLVPKEDRDAAFELLKQAEEKVKAEDQALKGLRLKEEQIKLDIERAKVDVAVKKTQWEQAKYVLEKCELKAPCDGTVLRLLVNVGDTIGPAAREPAVIFCPLEQRIIRAEVEQEFASMVHVGQAAKIEDDARLRGDWHGTVKRISDWYLPRRSVLMEPKQLNDVRTIECIIKLDDATGLKIGQRVRVTLGRAD